jgi:hypothetical protein
VTSTAGVPTGSVSFSDGGTTLGTVAVNGSGQAALVVNLPAGVRGLTATYGGDPARVEAVEASLVFLGAQILRDNQHNLLSHRLSLGPSEQALGGLIPRGNDAVKRLTDDGIVRESDDRAQTGRRQVAL